MEKSKDEKAPGKVRRWRDVYPVLRACLSEGRPPSGEEMEHLAARLGREIGATAHPALRRRALLAAARAALSGRREPHDPPSRFPLVLRGH